MLKKKIEASSGGENELSMEEISTLINSIPVPEIFSPETNQNEEAMQNDQDVNLEQEESK